MIYHKFQRIMYIEQDEPVELVKIKGKKKFFKKDKNKKTKFKAKKKSFGFTNNPKYFGKISYEIVEKDDKRSSFKGRKKFKKRQRPKKFSFKKHKKK